MILQDLADEQLHATAAIGVRGVDEREAHVDGAAEDLLGIGLVDGAIRLTGEPPRADRELRDDHTRLAEGPFPHLVLLPPGAIARPPPRLTLTEKGAIERPTRFLGRS